MAKKRQQEIKSLLRDALRKLNKIVNGKVKVVSAVEGAAEAEVPNLPVFPINTVDDFDELERCIRDYPTFKENMVIIQLVSSHANNHHYVVRELIMFFFRLRNARTLEGKN